MPDETSTPSRAQRLVRYLRDCYQADNRELSFTIAAIAVDALRRGQSVLVASKMNHAVDVVGDKIEDLLGIRDFVVRGGRKQYLQELKQAVERMLSGLLPVPEATWEEVLGLRRRLRDLRAEIRDLESALARRSEREQSWGSHAVEGPRRRSPLGRLWSRVRAAVLATTLGKAPPYRRLMREYQGLTDRYVELCADLVRASIGVQLARLLAESRRTLVRFSQSLRSRTVSRRGALFERLDTSALFHAFPIWLVSLADVSSLVPMRRELFDLAILDEATQCDVASCLPVLQRARRAVVVGDPNQLRHLSFLSRARQERAAERAGLTAEDASDYDYRGKSILDLVSEKIPRQDQVTLLDEHFRSLPPIIEFSNREFYRGRLKVMQERPGSRFESCQEVRFVGGRRREDGTNPEEASALVDEVLALVREEETHPPEMRHSLGVLSPFAAQVDLLTRLLSPRLGAAQLAAHGLRVGTPYSFQGEERDVMFLSLAVDTRSHGTAFRFLERPDVFNVAVTRARSRQLVFASIHPREAPAGSLLGRFLEHLERSHESIAAATPAAHDPFLAELADALAGRGWATWTSYPIAGFRVDLVAERDGRALGIDLGATPASTPGLSSSSATASSTAPGCASCPSPIRPGAAIRSASWRRSKQLSTRAPPLASRPAETRPGRRPGLLGGGQHRARHRVELDPREYPATAPASIGRNFRAAAAHVGLRP